MVVFNILREIFSVEKFATVFVQGWSFVNLVSSQNKASTILTLLSSSDYFYVFYVFSQTTCEHESTD